MVSDVLSRDIQAYAVRMETRNALWIEARDGSLTPQIAVEHLHQVQHLILHTPVHLDQARSRSLEIGDTPLAQFYAAKRGEEQGHDAWARDDIAGLRDRYGVSPSGLLVPALLAQISGLHAAIERDPVLYLSYVLFAELHIVLMGQRWLAMINERCGISTRHFSVISQHVELDQGHVSEGLVAIDQLVRDAAKLEPMREVLHAAGNTFEALCCEVVELGRATALAAS